MKNSKFKKFPKGWQFGQFFNTLTKREKIYFFILFFLAISSLIFLNLNFYFKNTKVVPAFGGTYKEGLVGQPRFINPLYLSTKDADRDLVELLFSGLMKYDENGNLVKDLIKDYKIEKDGKVFDIQIKNNVFWHDGKPLSGEDVIFTVNLIQNPQYQSPLRVKWLGIKAEKVSTNEVRFLLPEQYSGFLENLTLRIIPEHIFKNISPKNLPWSLTSSKYLIGSGPFKFKALSQDKSGYIKELTLVRNKNYYGKKPFLSEITFYFYKNEDELLRAAKSNKIQGFSLNDPKYLGVFKNKDFNLHLLSLPRYFAVFFNLREKNIFSDKNLRETLALAINKDEILEKVFSRAGEKVNSPILPKFFGFAPASKTYNFDKKKSQEILEKIGFKLNKKTNKREKILIKKISSPFQRNLKYGSRGEDVRELQKCLAKDKKVYPENVISGYFGKKTKAAVIRFQEKYAKDILTPIGLKKGTGDVKSMTRKKLNEICFTPPKETIPLKLTLSTVDEFPLSQIAEILKKDWESIGAEVEIKKVNLGDLQNDVLAKRDFEILLFGEALNSIADPFSFWHSSQREYPGLNISGYNSKKADNLLSEARESFKENERKKYLEEFQNILVESIPAIFLVRADYLYFLSPRVKGYKVKKIITPAKRFSGIENLYVKTKRIWKQR